MSIINKIISKLARNQLLGNNIEKAYCGIPYRFGKGKALAPLSVVLLISYRCNLRCKMCFYYNEVEKDKTCKLIENRTSEELTLSEIKELIDDCAEMGVKVFTIHGGEPLLYPNIFVVSKYARSRGLLVNFVTNGTLINSEVANKIVDAGINHITFSIDGPREIHDEVRSIPGTFDRVINGIRLLIDIEGAPSMSVSTYVSALNQSELAKTMKIVRDSGIRRWGVGLITHNSDKLASATRMLLGDLSEDGGDQGNLSGISDEVKNIDLKVLRKQRKKILNRNGNEKYQLDIIFPSSTAIDEYYNPGFNELDKCIYPWARTVISPYGEVFPCVNLSMVGCVLGNIKEESLKKIWNGEEYVWFRKKLKGKGLFSLCSKCCHINNVRGIEYEN